jgi:acido-empty-quinoprotein group A
MNLGKLLFAFVLLPAALAAQNLDSSVLLNPPRDTWPTYNGDYSGRRFSALTQINSSNVGGLQMQWIHRVVNSDIAGFGSGIKSTPLLVNGILYFSMADNVWAVDARSGNTIWHYQYPPNESIATGSRGVAVYHDAVLFETRDCNLVSLNGYTGELKWKRQIGDVMLGYFCTPPPILIRNHLIVGVGGDSQDNPGYLESRDPETGQLQWHWDTEPKSGQPGSETWPDLDSMAHGGGMTWMPGTYDPELNLIYWGTGNPNPVHAGAGREGANLWTSCIVALNPDTGKLVWYFQPTPHDTHDYDATQTPVLIDGEFHGHKRKLLAQANRNGYFFLLDRSNGEHLLTSPFVPANWASGIDSHGIPIPDPRKEPSRDGTLVLPESGGATNWYAPTFDPETSLFYVNASATYSIFYLTAEGKAEGFAGRDEGFPGKGMIDAIDYQTGKICWSHDLYGTPSTGMLSTAGKLLFAGDDSGNFMALDTVTGRTLWHVSLGANVHNGPITYELDGRQYVLVGAGNTLVAFALPVVNQQARNNQ